MRKTAIALTAVGLVTAFTAGAPASAEAHAWHRGGYGGYGWHRHNNGGAIALGIIGSILTGAAIASSHPYAYGPYGTPYGYAGYGYYYR